MDKMGITSGQRTMCLEMLQQMAYATSEEGYSVICSQFCSCTPSVVVDYVNANWHSIHKAVGYGNEVQYGNVLNGTNNHLECINQKLKSVIIWYLSL